MKQLLFITLLGFISMNSFAQCDDIKEKKDDFSGKVVRSAKVVVGNLKTKWLVEISQVEGKTTMEWNIAMVGEFNQRVEPGTPLLLKLEDGTVVTLLTTGSSTPVTKVVNGMSGSVSVFSSYVLKYDVPKDAMAKLAKSPVENIKVDIPGQDIKNPKLKDNQMSKMQDVFACLNSK